MKAEFSDESSSSKIFLFLKLRNRFFVHLSSLEYAQPRIHPDEKCHLFNHRHFVVRWGSVLDQGHVWRLKHALGQEEKHPQTLAQWFEGGHNIKNQSSKWENYRSLL